MFLERRVYRMCVIGICCIAFMAAWVAAPAAARVVTIDTEVGEPIRLVMNRLAKIKSRKVIKRAHVVNPDIAELVYSKTQSPYWVFLSGKSIGTTQLTLWGNGNELLGSYEVTVRADVGGLKKDLYEIFPTDDITVRDSGEHVTLTGTVSDSVRLTKVLALAEAYAPDKVINLLQVGGVQQVMLEVRIAEISRTVTEKLGVNLAFDAGEEFGLTMLDQFTSLPAAGWPGNPLQVSSSANAVLGFIGGDSLIVTMDALQEDGLLKILAKPTLIAQSGHDASFLAGGEFPFPVAEDFQQYSIEWKPFGVGLNFTPTVLGDGRISMVVSPEVSELDFTRTITFSGFVVPSIDTRRMSTVVELRDNQSFAIGGLLKNFVRESVHKFPLLGDIPIIGALFRSTSYQKDETELVVIVTPHLVKPMQTDDLTLPTDSFIDPSPFELMMLGMLEAGRKQEAEATGEPAAGAAETATALEGDFGYIIPE